MANRIKKYRNRAGLTQEQLATLVGTGKSMIVKLERGERDLNERWLTKISKVLDCQPKDLLDEDVAIVGKIGAGGSIIFEDMGETDRVARPPETAGTLVGLEVEGESMLPKFDPGDIVFISRDHDGVNPTDIGSYCAVRLSTGETLLKILARGSRPGAFSLRSLNAADIEDVALDWASPIRAITPRAARRFT
ncbi:MULTISPECIES: helix-turn-helix domain-containing protein [Sphingomonas]|uniref:helix-turn-helix domain-containing protein n=1 Tax=Sphingomonas TaxID=13687 RepID=UPI00254BC5B3|nr:MULTISPECIES: helix-turn-helix domain-containing protein [Sphingomonas]MDK8216364.1 helix-turn-helix domain-containing protein [Sphingomonas sp. UMB7805-LC452B]